MRSRSEGEGRGQAVRSKRGAGCVKQVRPGGEGGMLLRGAVRGGELFFGEIQAEKV